MQTFTGKEYLKIDIASNFGLDKSKWNDRIAWFDKNEDKLFELVNQAEEPALFYAGIKAWEETKAGQPTGYMISLDATSSGLQLLAALTGDNLASKLCNVVDTGEREDAYTKVYEYMLEKIEDTSKIKREDTKDAILTALYGSTAVPKKVFGEGNLLNVFYETMQEVAPAAWDLNQFMLAIWDNEALSNDWVLPDNYHVHVKVMGQIKETFHFLNEPFEVFTTINMPIENGRSLGANMTHSVDGMIVREITRRCDYNPKRIEMLREILDGKLINITSPEDNEAVLILWDHYKESGYLSARILDHLNSENSIHVDTGIVRELIDSLPDKPFKVVSIHDCFRCLPNYGNALREQYNRQLMLIAKSNLLQFVISQIIGRKVKIGKLDPELHTKILETNYALS